MPWIFVVACNCVYLSIVKQSWQTGQAKNKFLGQVNMKNNIPGWTIYIDEISNGVFKVTLTDRFGRKAEVVDNASAATIDKAKDYAFDIERKVSKSWNKFLFDFCVMNIGDINILTKRYDENVFGSWFVELADKRFVYDGRDFMLTKQIMQNGVWAESEEIKNDNISYSNFIVLLNS